MLDSNEQVLSEPVEFLDQSLAVSPVSQLALVTFLIDERTNDRMQLTPEQHRIILEQAEFTPRTCLTYLVNSENVVISKAIQMFTKAQPISHAADRAVLHRLSIHQEQRETLQTEQIFVEKILPLLGETHRELH